MKINKQILTKNRCYTAGTTIKPHGLMLHSIGCPQPKASVLVNSWNNSSCGVCVHGFIDGNSGDVYQTLPWNRRGWHCGSGSKGSGNNTHIGIEMCEPACIRYTSGAAFTCSDKTTAKAVVKRTYESAVELFAYLCKEYGLDPTKDGVIISHKEGHARGIASNHGDPEHLWSGLGTGYTMDTFRKAVKAKMAGSTDSTDSSSSEAKNVRYRVRVGAYSKETNARVLVKKLKVAGFTAAIHKSGGLYKVQAGAFAIKSNAQKRLKKVQAAGFEDAYITTEK